MLKRSVQGIEGLLAHAANVLRHIEQHELIALRKVDIILSVRAVLPDLVFVVVLDRLNVCRFGGVAVVYGGVLRHVVHILRQIVDALGVKLADEVLRVLGDGSVVLRVPGDAEVGQRRDRDSAGLVRMPFCLGFGGAGLHRQGDALVDNDDGGGFVHGVDLHLRPLHVPCIQRDGRGIVRVLRVLGDRQLRAGGDVQGSGADPVRRERKLHPVVFKALGGVAFNADAAQIQNGGIGVRRILGIVDQIPRLLRQNHIVCGQDRKDAGLVGDVVVFGPLAVGCGRDDVGAGRLAGGTGQREGKLRLGLSLAGVSIGPGARLGVIDSRGHKRLVPLCQTVKLHGERGIRGDGIGERFDDIVRGDGHGSAVDGQKAGFINHLGVALGARALRRDDIGAHVLAFLAGEGVFERLSLLQAGDLRIPYGIVVAIGLAEVLRPHRDLVAGDGEGTGLKGDGIVALRLLTRYRDEVFAYRLALGTGNIVCDDARRVLVLEAVNLDGEGGVCLTVSLADVVRGHGHGRGLDGEIVVHIANLIVALPRQAGNGDAIASPVLADIAVGVIGDRVPVPESRDLHQRRVGVAVDLSGRARYGDPGGGDGQGAVVQADAVAPLTGLACKLNGIAAHILPWLTGACEADLRLR